MAAPRRRRREAAAVQVKQTKHYNAELYVYRTNEKLWHLNYIPKLRGYDDDAKTLVLIPNHTYRPALRAAATSSGGARAR